MTRHRRCVWLAGILWVTFCAVAFMAPDAEPDRKARLLAGRLEAQLQEIARNLDGVIGFFVQDLTTGDRIALHDQEVFPTASAIKLAILYELFAQADAGRLSLEEPMPLDRRAVVGGAGILQELTAPVMPLRDYATLMIVLSDNTATNMLIDRAGLTSVSDRLRALGLARTQLRRRMIDAGAARRGDENVSTPAELGRLLELMHQGHGLRPESQASLLEILKKKKSSAMTRGLPAEVPVAGKSGSLEGVRVDAGIVYLATRPYIFAAMATYLQHDAEGEQAIEHASRAVYGYFSRLAAGTEYGRQIDRR
jgi:beta-lactamase class A